MAQNTGTLISAAIRPNDSLDPIASAFASEIKGGLHTVSSVSDRNNIIFERREWGMMCYVTSIDKTYQLKFGFVSSSIMDNNNWVEFTGSGGSGGGETEWIDSVISVSNTPPITPSDGDRYILGSFPSGSWSSLTASLVLTYNQTLATWTQTIPTNGMSVIVDIEDNSIYKYVGNFPSGNWIKEKVNQLRSISLTSINGLDYTATSNPAFSVYDPEIMFLAQFDSPNTGTTVSVNINGLGQVDVKKPSQSGLVDLISYDIRPGVIYNLTYDGVDFQLNRPYTNDDVFSVKHYVEATDYIVVPQYYQYWVYADLEIVGHLVNYGQVIIANGGLILSGGTFSNFGALAFANFDGTSSEATFYSSNTILFTQSNTIYGPSVSATVIDGSITQSKISIQNTGSNGYVLGYTSSGDFFWYDSSLLVPASTITGVTAGFGLTGGGTDPYITIDVQLGQNSGLTFSPSGEEIILDVDNTTIQIIGGKLTGAAQGIIDITVSDGIFGGGSSSTVNLSLTSSVAGVGLTYASGVLDIELTPNKGLSFSSSGPDSTLELLIDVNSGLTFSNGALSLLSGSSQPVYQQYNMLANTSGDFQATGLTLSFIPNDYSRIQLFVNGQIQLLGNGVSSSVDCYFWNGFNAVSFNNLTVGDELYWNGTESEFDLEIGDSIYLIYET
jgi:hypothetical protein